MTSKTVNTIIDDADGQAQYSIGWESDGSSNEYNHTTKATRMQGATFTLKFVGTSIKVYGTLTEHQEDNPGTFPNTTYSIDGDTPVRFAGIPGGAPQYQQLFYQSPPLPNLEHTLVGTCADDGSLVWLDYFVVEMTIDAGQPASSLSSLPTHTVTSVVSAPSAPPASASHATTPPIGAIVGGIVGGFALLLLALAFLLWYRRYQHEPPYDVPKDVGSDTSDMRGRPLHPATQTTGPRTGVFSASSSGAPLSSANQALIDSNTYTIRAPAINPAE
ncbi:hypothetical protein EYR40_010250 [Pleurotus pulmonarius]|nr:hypothetical protein EYR40_010250 [Pleurotus pulmonarius]